MTLIAGFKAYGVPILLGDFLITSAGHQSGLRKKVRRLRPNCVIAWTGSEIGAGHVVGYLDQHLPEAPTREQLHECLRSYNVSDLRALRVRFIGWIVDDGAHCFNWTSDNSQVVASGDPAFDGSGANTIAAILGRKNVDDEQFNHLTDIERAVQHVLHVATQLLGDEAFARRNRSQGFGHFYEILYLREDHFEYADDVLYAVITVPITAEGTIQHVTFSGNVYKYRALEELSVVDTLDPAAGVSRTIHLVTAVGDSRSRSIDVVLCAIARSIGTSHLRHVPRPACSGRHRGVLMDHRARLAGCVPQI